MALFYSKRDVSLVRKLNRELIHDIISQQVSIYKYKLGETETNIYGEASRGKIYDGPYLLFCLIDKKPQQHDHMDEGIVFNRNIDVSFYLDDLKEFDLFLEIGDIILFEDSYYEIAGIIENQFFGGNDPEHTNSNVGEMNEYVEEDNPLDTKLENFGNSISIVCRANYIPADKVNISPYLERM